MPPRHGSRQIATPPVERTQYTTSSEPDDEEDSTTDPRQASGNYHESEQSPEATREPSGGRTLSEIDEEIGTFWKLFFELCRQGFDYENLRQRAECVTRLQELRREFSNLIIPPQADLASPLPPIENPENSDINLNEHSYDRSAQEEVSAPQPGNTPIASIQGEDPEDPRDEMIPIQGRVSDHTVNPSSMPGGNLHAKIACDTAEIQSINVDPEAQARLVLAEIASNCKLAKITNEPAKIIATANKLIGSKATIGPGDEIRSIMTVGYDFMHARRPGVLALQGIG